MMSSRNVTTCLMNSFDSRLFSQLRYFCYFSPIVMKVPRYLDALTHYYKGICPSVRLIFSLTHTGRIFKPVLALFSWSLMGSSILCYFTIEDKRPISVHRQLLYRIHALDQFSFQLQSMWMFLRVISNEVGAI